MLELPLVKEWLSEPDAEPTRIFEQFLEAADMRRNQAEASQDYPENIANELDRWNQASGQQRWEAFEQLISKPYSMDEILVYLATHNPMSAETLLELLDQTSDLEEKERLLLVWFFSKENAEQSVQLITPLVKSIERSEPVQVDSSMSESLKKLLERIQTQEQKAHVMMAWLSNPQNDVSTHVIDTLIPIVNNSWMTREGLSNWATKPDNGFQRIIHACLKLIQAKPEDHSSQDSLIDEWTKHLQNDVPQNILEQALTHSQTDAEKALAMKIWIARERKSIAPSVFIEKISHIKDKAIRETLAEMYLDMGLLTFNSRDTTRFDPTPAEMAQLISMTAPSPQQTRWSTKWLATTRQPLHHTDQRNLFEQIKDDSFSEQEKTKILVKSIRKDIESSDQITDIEAVKTILANKKYLSSTSIMKEMTEWVSAGKISIEMLVQILPLTLKWPQYERKDLINAWLKQNNDMISLDAARGLMQTLTDSYSKKLFLRELINRKLCTLEMLNALTESLESSDKLELYQEWVKNLNVCTPSDILAVISNLDTEHSGRFLDRLPESVTLTFDQALDISSSLSDARKPKWLKNWLSLSKNNPSSEMISNAFASLDNAQVQMNLCKELIFSRYDRSASVTDEMIFSGILHALRHGKMVDPILLMNHVLNIIIDDRLLLRLFQSELADCIAKKDTVELERLTKATTAFARHKRHEILRESLYGLKNPETKISVINYIAYLNVFDEIQDKHSFLSNTIQYVEGPLSAENIIAIVRAVTTEEQQDKDLDLRKILNIIFRKFEIPAKDAITVIEDLSNKSKVRIELLQVYRLTTIELLQDYLSTINPVANVLTEVLRHSSDPLIYLPEPLDPQTRRTDTAKHIESLSQLIISGMILKDGKPLANFGLPAERTVKDFTNLSFDEAISMISKIRGDESSTEVLTKWINSLPKKPEDLSKIGLPSEPEDLIKKTSFLCEFARVKLFEFWIRKNQASTVIGDSLMLFNTLTENQYREKIALSLIINHGQTLSPATILEILKKLYDAPDSIKQILNELSLSSISRPKPEHMLRYVYFLKDQDKRDDVLSEYLKSRDIPINEFVLVARQIQSAEKMQRSFHYWWSPETMRTQRTYVIPLIKSGLFYPAPTPENPSPAQPEITFEKWDDLNVDNFILLIKPLTYEAFKHIIIREWLSQFDNMDTRLQQLCTLIHGNAVFNLNQSDPMKITSLYIHAGFTSTRFISFCKALFPNNELTQTDLFLDGIHQVTTNRAERLGFLKTFAQSLNDDNERFRVVESMKSYGATARDILEIANNHITSTFQSLSLVLNRPIQASLTEEGLNALKNELGDIPLDAFNLGALFAYYNLYGRIGDFLDLLKDTIKHDIQTQFVPSDSSPLISIKEHASLTYLGIEKLPSYAQACNYLNENLNVVPPMEDSVKALQDLIEKMGSSAEGSPEVLYAALLKKGDNVTVKDVHEFFVSITGFPINERESRKLYDLFHNHEKRKELTFLFSQENGINDYLAIAVMSGDGCVANIATNTNIYVTSKLIKTLEARLLYPFFIQEVVTPILTQRGQDLLGGSSRGLNPLTSSSITQSIVSPPGFYVGLSKNLLGGKLTMLNEVTQKLCREDEDEFFGSHAFIHAKNPNAMLAEFCAYLIIREALPEIFNHPTLASYKKRIEDIFNPPEAEQPSSPRPK